MDKQYLPARDLRLCGRTSSARCPQGAGAGRPLFRRHQAPCFRLYEGAGRGTVEAGRRSQNRSTMRWPPAQHELAPIFSTTNIAVDHNQLTMEMMKRVATRHGMACLLHEKPLRRRQRQRQAQQLVHLHTHGKSAGPRETPMENLQFLLFLAAVIKAVDQYQDLLPCPSPPRATTIVWAPMRRRRPSSLFFVGEELEAIIGSIASGADYDCPGKTRMELGVDILPVLRDTTDRNRTSPFAFTGNKFEFRMPGRAAMSIAGRKHRAEHRSCQRAERLCRRAGECGGFRHRRYQTGEAHHPRPQAHHLQRQRLQP